MTLLPFKSFSQSRKNIPTSFVIKYQWGKKASKIKSACYKKDSSNLINLYRKEVILYRRNRLTSVPLISAFKRKRFFCFGPKHRRPKRNPISVTLIISHSESLKTATVAE
ncbi:hypothetical protein CEXT_60281 [Caerostris extrusa]|uniref:Uncharacterized protein n=1 Tax=Caerostris extrusa TaxID=172846 RepID=A0AAV4RJZ2_CAEEX|nr:hypothetical protein CEXT_60281 [Caerostris extrusa]